ncbi:transmembrane protein 209-like [Drosophila ficusphila]|uniref:transmembrane protein 209-like n=1 Tax=Drosophila ficusphila TaxID=30025 RepID=UPI001C8AEA23|nr:transmembrane protein 209-like [Drosophila ficusphila]
MNCSLLRRSPLVQHSLDLRLRSVQLRHCLQRFFLNAAVLLLLLLDIWQVHCSCNRTSFWFVAECFACVALAFSALVCLGKYLWLLSGERLVRGTQSQKYLLDGRENEFGTVYTRPVAKAPDPWTRNARPIVQWHSFLNKTWGSGRNVGSLRVKWYPKPSVYEEARPDDFCSDIRKLPALMKRAEQDRRMEEDTNSPSFLLRHRFLTHSSHLKSIPYQLSAVQDEGPIVVENSEFLSQNNLLQWVSNLRFWISTTILHRLVREIDFADKMFRKQGLGNLRIGAISLERLRALERDKKFVAKCVPMLPVLLAFLDSFPNQAYLVQRIRQLSKGTLLDAYKWNSGGTNRGLPIVFHLLCVYLDSQLLPHPHGAGRRPFYSRYVVTRKMDIRSCLRNKAKCAILATGRQQRHLVFNFVRGRDLLDCAYDKNNLFYVILQFLCHLQKEQGSVLEGVSLGKRGINIMNVIQSGYV